ncbi:hypothetical protein FRC10_007799 [Ceratobasidium sp. 414]|nr:hypothetical protein FRC10_007799 [Ceratobasidium sp. 414]
MACNTHKCTRCAHTFRTKRELDEHMDTVNDDNPSDSPSPPPEHSQHYQYWCPYCSKGFSTQHGLGQHLARDLICRPLHREWLDKLDCALSKEPTAPGSNTAPYIENQTWSNEGGDGSNGSNGGDGSDGGDGGDGGDSSDGSGGEGEGEDKDKDRAITESDSEAEKESTRDSDEDLDAGEYKGDQSVRNQVDDMDIGDLPEFQEVIFPAVPPTDTTMDDLSGVQLEEVADVYGNKVYIEQYPHPTVGEPIWMEWVEDPATIDVVRTEIPVISCDAAVGIRHLSAALPAVFRQSSCIHVRELVVKWETIDADRGWKNKYIHRGTEHS